MFVNTDVVFKCLFLWKRGGLVQKSSLSVCAHKVWLYSLDKMIMSGPEAVNLANMYMTMIQSMCMQPVYVSLKLGMSLAHVMVVYEMLPIGAEGMKRSMGEMRTRAFLVA